MRWAHAPRVGNLGDYSTGRAVVGLDDPAAARAFADEAGVGLVYVEPTLRTMLVAGTPASLRALAARGDSRVRFVEPDRLVRFLHTRNDPRVNQIDNATGQPFEWTFAHLGVDRALNLGHGSASFLVGVVDSGIADVPDLAGKVAQAFYVPSETTSATDFLGHGTFVTSIIASNNDDGIGLAGFCGACRAAVYKIRDYFTATTAIQQLVDAGVRVINLSIGGEPGDASYALTDAVNYAVAHGVLIVSAAGNESSGQLDYPARQLQPVDGQSGVGLAVGASEADDTRAYWSNYGPGLSLLAPGTFKSDTCTAIFGALPPDSLIAFDAPCEPISDASTGAVYASLEGTSFSTPEVAGIAALVWSAAPKLKATDVVRILEETATRPSGTGWTPETGWGVVNAARAMEATTGRSSADKVVVSRVRPATPAVAGRLFQLEARAAWSDGVALPAATARCAVSVAGRRLNVNGQVAGGSVLCQWRIPPAAKGRRMRVALSVADDKRVTGAAAYSILVKAPPKAR